MAALLMRVTGSVAVLGFMALASALSAQQTSPPRFQSGVEVVPIDVTVVDDRGRPLPGLTSTDFTVRIDGQPRRVISAELISESTANREAASQPAPEDYVSNEQAAGRLILLVVDQHNIPFTALRPLQNAVYGFIDGLSPSDRTALIGFGTGAPSVTFTADRDRLKQALTKMPGQAAADGTTRPFPMSTSTAIAIDGGDTRALAAIASRDCAAESLPRDVCESQIRARATTLVLSARQDGDATFHNLRELLSNLKTIEAPKTLILLSSGFFVDRGSGDAARLEELGALASAARTSIYALQLQDQLIDITQAGPPLIGGALTDHQERRAGLDVLTAAARGTIFNLGGTGTGVFDRLRSELSGYYLLGVEPEPRDRDGKPHAIRVDVMRRGVTVRARRTTLLAAAGAETPSPRDAVTTAMRSPLAVSTLPLKGVVFALRGVDASRLQLMVHAEIGADYLAPRRVSVALAVLDSQGQSVGDQAADASLAPASPGMPSPLVFTAGASVAPGDYVVKLAAADGERVGTLEVPVHASLVTAGAAVTVSELIAGGAVPPGDLLHPTIGRQVTSGSLQGYLEAYGRDLGAIQVRFEIAAAAALPAILSAAVAARPAGDDRAIFSQIMRVHLLPPGRYRLRAVVSNGGRSVKTLTRAFEIPAPASDVASGAVLLPVEFETLARPFRPSDALDPTTLQAFRARVPDGVRELFEQGVSHLQGDRPVDAGLSFRDAARPGAGGAVAYLGVCLAVTGHDPEAVRLWRAALAEAADVPQLYQWLGEALLRSKDFGEARSVFEIAARRWPSDARVARSLALLDAMSGRGAAAVRSMEQVIRADPADVDARFLVLEWLFRLRRGGVTVHSADEDLQLARAYADAYAKASGASQPLVNQWLAYLEQQGTPPVRRPGKP